MSEARVIARLAAPLRWRRGSREAEERARRGKPGPIGIDYTQVPLGQFPDAVLARRLGVRRSTIASARRVRGIPPCGRVQRQVVRTTKRAPYVRRVRLPYVHRELPAAIQRALGRLAVPFRELKQRLADDYGTVEDRTIYRHLGALVRQGVVLREPDEDVPSRRYGCYRLSGQALVSEE